MSRRAATEGVCMGFKDQIQKKAAVAAAALFIKSNK